MIYFTPGPTQLFPKTRSLIEEALRRDIPSISHRSKKYTEIYKHTESSLRNLISIPQDFQIFFLSSGTEAMERIIQNCSMTHSHHFVNGAFSGRFFEIAKELGRQATEERVKPGHGFYFSKTSIPANSELICVTHNETSTGVAIPPSEISYLRPKCPLAIIAVDVVSSMPIVELAWSSIDCAFFSVQKCFGLPAGLGVVLVNQRAMNKALELQKKGVSIGSYHSFPSLLSFADKYQNPETPNVLGIYLLGEIADYLSKNGGLDKLRNESIKKSKLIYDFLDSRDDLAPFVHDKTLRSQTVITAVTKLGAKDINAALAKKGMEVGTGYGEFKDSHIRIANFPMHSEEDISRLIEALGGL